MASLVDIPVDYQQSLIEFSTSLYQGLNKQESVCMSPYSITAAFLLLMIGASGRSKQQISSALFQNSIFSEEEKLKYHKSLDSYIIEQAGVNVSLASANRLFVNNQFTVLQNVREKAKQYFGADISLKDFTKPKASAYMMNRWVSKQTNGKIKDLIKEKWLDSNTVMFIINAIYFKATWEKQFSPKHTRKGKFYLPFNKTIEIDMMNIQIAVPYFQGQDFSVIALPFKGGNFDMVFILPDEKVGLQNIETKITPKFLKTISTGLKSRFTSIAIPKFKLQSEFDLKTELPKFGVTDIFDDSKANFTDLIVEKIPGLYVMYAVHKAVFNVNEAGVEGAAGTVFGVGFKSGGHFTANRPFLFYVRDVKSGLILFIGRFHPQVRAG
ncbi:antithrombin-III-like [Mytilus californianus]|uniref:antithrombin-III-like n=1 Tax=Mytilus californianus TaxID=6549 RepID=UPI0022467396|nr:antithrombin-III-like [Mytilus californianus]